MLRICSLCSAVQKKNSSGNCNQPNCHGKLAKAWKCKACNKIQRDGKCACGGKLEKFRDEASLTPLRTVVPTSHIFIPTASALKNYSVETSSESDSPSPRDIRARLEAMHRAQPPTARKQPTSSPAPAPVDPAPSILRAKIPERTQRSSLSTDVGIARALMNSPQLRRIVVINMLDDYKPSEGARAALKMTEGSPKLKEMTLTMTVVPKDASQWNNMGLRAYDSGFAACQQCVAIMFHKLLQNSRFSSCIQLIQVPGHHFLVFGEMKNGSWVPNRTYICDLWLQNLHRPLAKSTAELGHETGEWPSGLTALLDPGQTYYQQKMNEWKADLTHDPFE